MKFKAQIQHFLCVAIVVFATQSAFAQTEQLPVIHLTADTLSTDFSDGTFRLEDGTVMNVDIRWRGATSLRYQKKSYAIKLKDAEGNKLNVSLLGMRSDNSWILDAMTPDKARMRNRVSTDLWLDFARKPYYYDQEPALVNGAHGKFVEVYLNNEYQGLYCLTEKVDRKQLKLKKFSGNTVHGLLYKLSKYNVMRVEDEMRYAYDNSSPIWDTWEMQYPDAEDGEPIDWAPLANTIRWITFASDEAINDSLDKVFDLPVWIDYFLMVDLMLGDDNTAKNLFTYFYDITQSDQKLSVAPWDMDATWGRDWKGNTLSAQKETGLYHQLQYHFLYTRKDSAQIYGPRYRELRETYFSANMLKHYFKTYFDLFRSTGVAKREEERWSGIDGIDIDFELEEQYIYEWIDQRLAFLDKYYKYQSIPSDYDKIDTLAVPVLYITTVNGEDPTCDYVSAPEGSIGASIANATKVPSRLLMTMQGKTLYDSGIYERNISGLTIKIRGNGSAYSDKKPYKLKLQKKADLLDRSNDSLYSDKHWLLMDLTVTTLFGLKVNELVGMPYTPKYRMVNVVLNNDYKGLYLLMEPVRRNPRCRINVSQTSGFIAEIDAYWWNEPLHFETNLINGPKYQYSLKHPDDADDMYISAVQSQLCDMEDAIVNGAYPNYIDVDSWAKWLLGHDILGTRDSGGSNRFFAKYDDSDTSKVFIPCMWDFDSTAGVTDDWARTHKSHTYMKYLLNSTNTTFVETYWSLWNKLSDTLIDSLNNHFCALTQTTTWEDVETSSILDGQRWNYTPIRLQTMMDELLEWFHRRQDWIDAQYKASDIADVSTVDTSFPYNIYTIQGTYIGTGDIRTMNLPRGIYIVNGKKYSIK